MHGRPSGWGENFGSHTGDCRLPTQPQKSVADAERCFTLWRRDARCAWHLDATGQRHLRTGSYAIISIDNACDGSGA